MRGIILLAAVACVAVTGSAPSRAADGNEVACTKGIFWPFSRNPGDCLTDAEKRNGQTGVYGNTRPVVPAPVAATPAAAPPPAVPVAAPPVARQNPVPPAVAAAPTPATAENCTKGAFWPFSRNPGDCLTDAEKQSGQTGVFGNRTAAPAAAAPQPAPTGAAQAESGDGFLNLWGLFGSRNEPAVAQSVNTAPIAMPAAATPAPAAPVIPVATATAENCTKGIFWPFSRNPGDCLTDAEKRNGQTGVYGNPNPVQRAPVPATAAAPLPAPAIAAAQQPAAAAAAQAESSDGILNLWGLFGSRNEPAVAQAVNAAPVAAPVAQVAATPAPAAPAAPVATATAENCTKGIFWPFSRDPGDCLTDAEKRNGQTGVYGNPNPVQRAPVPATVAAPVPAPAIAAAPAPAPTPAPTVPAAPAAPAAPVTAATAENCTKGVFWPFSRSPGDCLTDAEKRNGRTGVFGNPSPTGATPAQIAVAPAARAGAPAGAPAPAGDGMRNLWGMFDPAGETCTKGWFWPFSREPGDCLTDAEKRAGLTGTYGIPNAVAGAPAVGAPGTVPANPAPRPAGPAVVAVAPPGTTEETCTKSWLWPFSRDPGDCLTDAEKRNGQTGVYGFARALPGAQVVVLAPPPSSGGMFGLFGSGNEGNRGLLDDGLAPVVASAPAQPTGQAAPGQAAPGTPAPAASPTIMASLPPAPAPGAPAVRNNGDGGECTKGLFWPFSRNPGDCLTDAEKRNGRTGVFGDPTGRLGQGAAPATPAPAAAIAVAPSAPAQSSDGILNLWGLFGSSTPPAQQAPMPAVPTAPTPAPAAPNAVVAPGDDVQTLWGLLGSPAPTAPQTPSVTAVAAPSAAPTAQAVVRPQAAPAANAEAACTKGIFWPFVRNPGDCLTDAEKANAAKGQER